MREFNDVGPPRGVTNFEQPIQAFVVVALDLWARPARSSNGWPCAGNTVDTWSRSDKRSSDWVYIRSGSPGINPEMCGVIVGNPVTSQHSAIFVVEARESTSPGVGGASDRRIRTHPRGGEGDVGV